MGEGHALLRNQPQQHIGRITPRIDLLHPGEGRGIRAAPGMDMEHRRHRHVDVLAMDPALARRHAVFDHRGEHVQHDLAVAEVHPFRIAGRAGRMKSRRPRILVEIRKLEEGGARFQHLLVFALDRKPCGRPLFAVMHQHVFPNRRQPFRELFDKRQEVRVDQHHRRARVVQYVQQLLGREAEIDRLQNRAHHRDRKIALMIAVAVPIEHGDDVAMPDANFRQAAGQPPYALAKVPIGVSPQVSIYDLLIRRVDERIMQQMFDEKRIRIGRRRAGDEIVGHGPPHNFDQV